MFSLQAKHTCQRLPLDSTLRRRKGEGDPSSPLPPPLPRRCPGNYAADCQKLGKLLFGSWLRIDIRDVRWPGVGD